MEIVAIGSDNAAVEWGFPVKPNYTRKAFGFLGLPLHVDFIWNRGAYIMEILNLDELAKDRAYEFFFVLGPLRLKGGIGVPVNPDRNSVARNRGGMRPGDSASHPSDIAMSARSAVVLRDVKKSFPLSDGLSLEVLDVEHLALPAGSCTVLRGRSGSGKTTLLNLIAGVTVPSAGTIRVGDTDVFALSEARRDRFRAEQVGYVFQTFNLLSALSALENVMLAMMFADAVPKRLQRQRAADLLARLGLCRASGAQARSSSRAASSSGSLSRVRLANGPPLILADEPCASLDARTAGEVLAMFLAVCRQDEKTLLLVSHDEAALEGADRVIDMAELNRAEARRGRRMTGRCPADDDPHGRPQIPPRAVSSRVR